MKQQDHRSEFSALYRIHNGLIYSVDIKLCFYLVPGIMTDYLQVTVPVEEEEEFLHIYGDFHFPRLGMMCNVISCPSMSFFSTYAQYMEHFIKTHRSYIHLYKCVSCGRIFQKRTNGHI